MSTADPASATTADPPVRWRVMPPSRDVAPPVSGDAAPPGSGSRSPIDLVSRLRSSGVDDHRRLCPSIDRQLAAAVRRPVSLVLVNALDSDPVLRHNGRLFRDFPADVLAGAAALAEISEAGKAMIVADADAARPDPADLARQPAGRGVRIEWLSNPYPQADPTLLLHTVAGLRLRPGRVPTDLGVVVVDCAAAIRIAQTLAGSRDASLAPVAIRDHRVGGTHHVRVPRGTSLRGLLGWLGIDIADAAVWADDLLRGDRTTADTLLGSGELTFHLTADPAPLNPSPCIRCGWCLDICPTRLNPAGVLDAAQQSDPVLAERSGVGACIECGLCAYVCPSRLPLLEAVRVFLTPSSATEPPR